MTSLVRVGFYGRQLLIAAATVGLHPLRLVHRLGDHRRQQEDVVDGQVASQRAGGLGVAQRASEEIDEALLERLVLGLRARALLPDDVDQVAPGVLDPRDRRPPIEQLVESPCQAGRFYGGWGAPGGTATAGWRCPSRVVAGWCSR